MLGFSAKYDISLSSVESPIDASKQYGETKVTQHTEDGITKYSYEDDYIATTWYVGHTEFNFTLKNKTNHSLKINWDDISYVDIYGNVGRVMHSGVKYTDRNSSQPSTTIPKNAKISDILLPTDNVYFLSGQYGGWSEKPLIPNNFSTQNEGTDNTSKYIGNLTIMMPIIIEGIQNDYTFVFSVNNIIQSDSY